MSITVTTPTQQKDYDSLLEAALDNLASSEPDTTTEASLAEEALRKGPIAWQITYKTTRAARGPVSTKD